MCPQVGHAQRLMVGQHKEIWWLLAAWLALVVVSVVVATLATNNPEIVTAATMGTAITFGGLYLVYTWVIAIGISEREKLRDSLSVLAEHLKEAELLAERLSKSNARS